MEVVSLYELNKYLKQVIALNFTESLWVKAEITQCRFSRGHYYIELVEKSKETDTVLAQSSAVIWAGDALRIEKNLNEPILKFLQSGAELKLLVDPDYHERYGLKLIIRDIDQEFTIGQLEIKKREALEKLHAEGLLQLNKQNLLPPVLQKIAVISSPTAAGYKDFMAQLHQNGYGIKFHSTLFEAAMQGAYVERDIVQHLIALDDMDFDCVVIIRGGGSRMDLSDFDTYGIGKAIALSTKVVFTGIGHEIDRSIADEVAHTSLKTPTAVAEHIISIAVEFWTELQFMVERIEDSAFQYILRQKTALQNLSFQLNLSQSAYTQNASNNLSTKRMQLKQFSDAYLWKKDVELQQMKKQLHLLDFRSVLRRGFALSIQNGLIIQDIKDIRPEQVLTTRMKGGQILSEIKEINYEQEKSTES